MASRSTFVSTSFWSTASSPTAICTTAGKNSEQLQLQGHQKLSRGAAVKHLQVRRLRQRSDFVVVCEVQDAQHARVFHRHQTECRGKPRLKNTRTVLAGQQLASDGFCAGVSRRSEERNTEGAKAVFSVDERLVKPVYMVAVRLPYHG